MSEKLAFRTAQRHVQNYAEESQDLSRQHEAMDCRDCESFLQLGIDAFEWLVRADQDFRIAVAEGRVEYDPQTEIDLRTLCTVLLETCRSAGDWIGVQSARGFALENLLRFQGCVEEMQAIVDSFATHTAGEQLPAALSELRNAAVEEQQRGQTTEFV